MKTFLRQALMALPPVRRHYERVRSLIIERDRLAAENEHFHAGSIGTSPHQIDGHRFEQLPGNAYARYLMPIEYMPSRDLRPRWGNSRPVITQLDSWFEAHRASYSQFLVEMRAQAPSLRDVPLDFDERDLPSPAWYGVPYSPFDALALYTLVKKLKPKRYIEIGSGITTCFAHRAIKDAGLSTMVVSIDPEPRAAIDAICDEVVRDGLEMMDITFFDQLEENDILFFDGSHRAFMNSDVTVFFIDVLPRIKPGVMVHIHDITLPWDYPEMFRDWYWNEQYMLAVYLMGRMSQIEPVLPTAWVTRRMSDQPFFLSPGLELGSRTEGLFGGGAMWFRAKPLTPEL